MSVNNGPMYNYWIKVNTKYPIGLVYYNYFTAKPSFSFAEILLSRQEFVWYMCTKASFWQRR